MRRLRAAGKVKYAGLSCHGPRGKGDSVERVCLAAVEDGRFDLLLVIHSFINDERRVLAACQSKQVGVTLMKTRPARLKLQPFDPAAPENARLLENMARAMGREAALARVKDLHARQQTTIEKNRATIDAFVARHGIRTEEQLAQKSVQWACLAFKGARYLKVLSLKARLDATLCRGILAAVARRLPGDNQRPRELALLPASRQVAGTLGYTRGSFLGTRQLNDCVHADYTSASGKRYTLFVLVLSAARTADAAWRGLAGAWKVERLGKTELVSWRHPYRGTLGIIRRKGAIVGAVGVGDGKATAALLEGL